MPYGSAGGAKIYHEVAGDGPPMVLLHATPWDHDMWLYQVAHFSTWFRVINIDLRAFGRSEPVRTPYGMDALVADVAGVMAAEDASGAVLMGASVGSRLGLRLAHDRPDLFGAAVVVGGNARAGQSEGGSDARREERIARYESGSAADALAWQITGTLAPDFADSALGRYLMDMTLARAPRQDGPAIAQLFRAVGYDDLRALLPAVSIPVLVVSGEHDRSIPAAKETASLIPDGRHVLIEGAGHCCCIEDPAAFDGAVIEFLRDHGAMPELRA